METCSFDRFKGLSQIMYEQTFALGFDQQQNDRG